MRDALVLKRAGQMMSINDKKPISRSDNDRDGMGTEKLGSFFAIPYSPTFALDVDLTNSDGYLSGEEIRNSNDLM